MADPSHSASPAAGAWTPLRNAVFRSLWIATVASNVGTWINDTTSAWLMTGMAPSPLLVSLVQAATTLPICLLAIPAGTLADILDRRRLLLVAQSWMAMAAAGLATLTALGLLTPALLLALTACLGIGAALTMPAWAATVPELVDRRELPAAIALGSLGINIARSIGPALGGVLIAALGPAFAYGLNALSFLGVIGALVLWRRNRPPAALPPENFAAAMRTGWRYVREAPAVQAMLVRCLAFFVFVSATWALLPLIARHDLGGDALLYGGLLGAVGVGAVTGALLMPRVLRRYPRSTLVIAATLAYAATMVVLALSRSLWLIGPCMLLTGASWLVLMSSFQVAIQTAVPAWVRARALSLNIVVFAGSMAGGSVLWGAVATAHGVTVALLVAAAGAAAGAALAGRFPLGDSTMTDFAASAHWPQPIVAEEVPPDRGPVLVTVEYRVDLDARADFLATVRRLGRVRRRDGALRWGVFEDAAEPGLYLEAFIVASWVDHLRQHERVTVADRALEDAVRAFHHGTERPEVRHLLAGSPATVERNDDVAPLAAAAAEDPA